MRAFLTFAVMAGLGLGAALAAEKDGEQKVDGERIAKLIAQLGSDSFTEREEASKALEVIGAAAQEALEKAVVASDLETRKRAQAVLKKIEENRAAKDLEAFRAYLAKNHPGKWERGPIAIESDEIRKAYGTLRFYAVVSLFKIGGVPPPVLKLGEQDPLQKEMDESISEAVSIDEKGTVTPLGEGGSRVGFGNVCKVQDQYRRGLMKVASKEDARIAASAFLSVFFFEERRIAAADVKVSQSKDGWTCRVLQIGDRHDVDVFFDANGKCTDFKVGREVRRP